MHEARDTSGAAVPVQPPAASRWLVSELPHAGTRDDGSSRLAPSPRSDGASPSGNLSQSPLPCCDAKSTFALKVLRLECLQNTLSSHEFEGHDSSRG